MVDWIVTLRSAKRNKCRRVSLSKPMLYLGLLVVITVMSGLGSLMWQYWSYENLQAENVRLKQSLNARKMQMEYLETRMSDIRHELAGSRNLGSQVAKHLGHSEIQMEGGIGGPLTVNQDGDIRRITYIDSESEFLDRLYTELEELEIETQLENGRNASLARFLRSHSALLKAIPNIRPVEGGYISSPFGRRVDPFSKKVKMHMGIDIAHDRRVPVYATAEGVVIEAGWNSSYGNIVTIYHGFGLTTRYAHLSRIDVNEGDWIGKKQVVGLLGNTGRSKSQHLHYEVRLEGRPVNPYYFLPESSQS
ncbi:M23 family metallopeptidase [bacterium]|nr:M23 family metallopeptidase [candidate division CSSED10-310 bacterium]